jgi:hypothetical protein
VGYEGFLSLMKYLFLDIDGVLNSDIYMTSNEYISECKSLGIVPEGRNVMDKAHHLHISPIAMKLLNVLVERSKAIVILSSTWRLKYSLAEMNMMFQKRGATFQIADVTPAKMSWRPRGMDIAEYLSNLKRDGEVPEAFVILDDIDEFSKLKEHFIQTSEESGLTQEDIARALKILGVEDSTSQN